MPSFYEYMMRHGEFGVQAIVELIERNEGIRRNSPLPLEDRWNAVMQPSPVQPSPFTA